MSTGGDETDLAQAAGAVEELARVAFEVMARLTRVAATEDLSLTQLRMLAILRDRTPRMAELAEALGIDRSSVTGLIARAEQRGLTERIAAVKDGRGVSVTLTAEGHAFAKELVTRISDALEPLLAAYELAERTQLEQLLLKTATGG